MRVRQLEQALEQARAERLLNTIFLQLACDELGQDVESFKKTQPVKRPP